MNRWMAPALVAALVGALTTLAGCGSASQQDAPLAPYTASNPPSVTPTPAAWLPMLDRRSGVRFELPHRKKPVFGKGKPASWIYSVPIDGGNQDGDQLSVALVFFDGGIPALPTILDNLTAAAKRAGMPDAARLRTHATRVDGVAAQTGALQFTATTGQKAYWLTTEFATGRYAVAAQAYSLSAASALPTRKQEVDDLLRRLVASIKLP